REREARREVQRERDVRALDAPLQRALLERAVYLDRGRRQAEAEAGLLEHLDAHARRLDRVLEHEVIRVVAAPAEEIDREADLGVLASELVAAEASAQLRLEARVEQLADRIAAQQRPRAPGKRPGRQESVGAALLAHGVAAGDFVEPRRPWRDLVEAGAARE